MEAVSKTGKKLTGAAAMGAGPGRPKGLPNKATREFKEVVQMLLRENSDNVARWLKMVAEGDPMREIKADPYKALDLLGKLAEYATPKLARTEHTGADGGVIKQDTTFRVTFESPER